MARDWVIKSISITTEDAKIAAKVGNLSKFTRVCLRRWSAWEAGQGKHAQPGVFAREGVCSPQSNCVVCWPHGTPEMEHWDRYLGVNPEIRLLRNPDPRTAREYLGPEVGDLEWFRDQVPSTFEITEIDSKGNETPDIARPGAKRPNLLRRMLNFLGK